MDNQDFEPEIEDTEDFEDESLYGDKDDTFWAEHEENCDGCSTCNPTAFREE